MQTLQNAVQTHFWAVRDYLAPVLKDSKFKEHGRITPDEFVAAGDFLVYKFPTWSWESGDKSKLRDFLPPDRQYLVQRNVPCIRRVSQMQHYAGDGADDDKETLLNFDADELLGDADAGNGDEAWVATHTGARGPDGGIASSSSIPDIPDIEPSSSSSTSGPSDVLSARLSTMGVKDGSRGGEGETTSGGGTHASASTPNIDEIPDIEDDDDDDFGGAGVTEPEDEAAVRARVAPDSAQGGTSSATLAVRTYDCYITYDKYYQVPRMWLSGLSPSRQPLTTQEIFEDVSSDYAQKTVTIEPFPHRENVSMASVHPCKHANVMKKVIERMNNAVKEQQRKQRAAVEAGAGIGNSADASVVGGGSGGGGGGSLSPRDKEKEKKKGWGITSAVKRAAGVGSGSRVLQTHSGPAPGEDDEVEGLRVDQYLLVFLKFLSNVVPTIELDATTSL